LKRLSPAAELLRDFIAATAVLFLAAALVFRIVDPRDDFETGIFPVIIRDSRIEKMRLFSADTASGAIQGLVLGSSRSMKLAPEVLQARTGLRFFNFAVDSGRAEDDLAIFRWVRQQGVRPALLVIGLDVEALHNDDVPDEELQKNQELRRLLTGRDDRFHLFWTYKRAFTPTYFTDTIMSIRRQFRPAVPMYSLDQDGRLRNRDIDRQRAAGTFDFTRQIATCLDVYVARFQSMTALSPARKRHIEQLIAEERAAGGQTIVWITPLHPRTARYLASRTEYPRMLRLTRAFLDELRASGSVTAYDFSEPDRYGGTLTDWDDCAHTDEIQSDQIAAALTPKPAR
jgi:hypothetical protein